MNITCRNISIELSKTLHQLNLILCKPPKPEFHTQKKKAHLHVLLLVNKSVKILDRQILNLIKKKRDEILLKSNLAS